MNNENPINEPISKAVGNFDFIIPAIDIIDGKCVRLTKGDFSKKTIYSEDPLQVAKSFEDAGIKRLHLVDLDGARAGTIRNIDLLTAIANATDLIIDFGGGVNSIEDIKNILDAGADMVTLGTIAVKHPELLEEWVLDFGADKFLVGVDVLHERVKIKGWQLDAGLTIIDMVRKMLAIGILQIFCTDISKDGMMTGPSINLYRKIITEIPEINLIASGGVTSWDDINDLMEVGCKAAIVGKALYEGNMLTLK